MIFSANSRPLLGRYVEPCDQKRACILYLAFYARTGYHRNTSIFKGGLFAMTHKKGQPFWMRMALVVVASFVMAFTIKSFARPGGIFSGGFNGISLLIIACCEKFLAISPPFALVNYTLNLIPLYISFRYLGKNLTVLSVACVALIGFLTDALPAVSITQDPLLVAVFGGIFNGLAVSLCLLANASGGGTDIIGLFMAEIKGRDCWNAIFLINVGVLTLAGILFGWDKALYSIIYQFVSTQVIHALHKRYQRHTLWIITDRPEEIYQMIAAVTNHDATLFKGVGCYKRQERPMLYSVVSSDELKLVCSRIHAIDPTAFVNIQRTEMLNGRFYQKPND